MGFVPRVELTGDYVECAVCKWGRGWLASSAISPVPQIKLEGSSLEVYIPETIYLNPNHKPETLNPTRPCTLKHQTP